MVYKCIYKITGRTVKQCQKMTFSTIYRLIALVLLIFCLISVFHPERHAKHYYYIPVDTVLSELVVNEDTIYSNLKSCSYEDVILNNKEIRLKDIYKKYDYILPFRGGEYLPKYCKPKFKVAILIPYRKRKEQLKIFLNYAHYFLQTQHIHYKIYVIDQQDCSPFNRAKMFNIGAVEAMASGYPCLILHDVDLIPLTSGNIYACSKKPRHMSSSLDSFRFNLPYEGLFGGVISIQSKQFKNINGMSNMFEGWGGEDDDLFGRLDANDYKPYRFSPEISKYTMLKHKKATPSENRYELLHSTLERQKQDGLNTLSHISVNYTVREESLYTHIIVK